MLAEVRHAAAGLHWGSGFLTGNVPWSMTADPSVSLTSQASLKFCFSVGSLNGELLSLQTCCLQQAVQRLNLEAHKKENEGVQQPHNRSVHTPTDSASSLTEHRTGRQKSMDNQPACAPADADVEDAAEVEGSSNGCST